MGSTLTNTQPKDTYKSLLKTSDSTELSATAKYVSDGNGNDSPLALSTNGVGVGLTSFDTYSVGSAITVGRVGSSVWSNGTGETNIFANIHYNSGYKYSASGAYGARINVGNTNGNIIFYTDSNAGTAGAAASLAERLRITANGLTFNGDTAAANALDDYEEGTWTPTIGAASGSATYSNQQGYYTKIGRQVTINWFISFQKNTLAGSIKLASLPFTVSNNSLYYPQSYIMFDNLASSYDNPLCQLNQGNTFADLITGNGSTGSHAVMQDTQLGAGTMAFRGTVTYFV